MYLEYSKLVRTNLNKFLLVGVSIMYLKISNVVKNFKDF